MYMFYYIVIPKIISMHFPLSNWGRGGKKKGIPWPQIHVSAVFLLVIPFHLWCESSFSSGRVFWPSWHLLYRYIFHFLKRKETSPSIHLDVVRICFLFWKSMEGSLEDISINFIQLSSLVKAEGTTKFFFWSPYSLACPYKFTSNTDLNINKGFSMQLLLIILNIFPYKYISYCHLSPHPGYILLTSYAFGEYRISAWLHLKLSKVIGKRIIAFNFCWLKLTLQVWKL